ncbi:hypothetical protein FPQ18DRAFT_390368 [Pyronema domesticum]|nr:hypothetical protein FPQ18DRAFT_390368 [Pyronema domesticum]
MTPTPEKAKETSYLLSLSAGPEITEWAVLDKEEHHTLSDQKIIIWATPGESGNDEDEEEEDKVKQERKKGTSKIRTGWKIERIEEEEKEEARKYYKELEKGRRNLDEQECTAEDIEEEVTWLEETMTSVR